MQQGLSCGDLQNLCFGARAAQHDVSLPQDRRRGGCRSCLARTGLIVAYSTSFIQKKRPAIG